MTILRKKIKQYILMNIITDFTNYFNYRFFEMFSGLVEI